MIHYDYSKGLQRMAIFSGIGAAGGFLYGTLASVPAYKVALGFAITGVAQIALLELSVCLCNYIWKKNNWKSGCTLTKDIAGDIIFILVAGCSLHELEKQGLIGEKYKFVATTILALLFVKTFTRPFVEKEIPISDYEMWMLMD